MSSGMSELRKEFLWFEWLEPSGCTPQITPQQCRQSRLQAVEAAGSAHIETRCSTCCSKLCCRSPLHYAALALHRSAPCQRAMAAWPPHQWGRPPCSARRPACSPGMVVPRRRCPACAAARGSGPTKSSLVALRVAELRQQLRDRGLSDAGLKGDLVARLHAELSGPPPGACFACLRDQSHSPRAAASTAGACRTTRSTLLLAQPAVAATHARYQRAPTLALARTPMVQLSVGALLYFTAAACVRPLALVSRSHRCCSVKSATRASGALFSAAARRQSRRQRPRAARGALGGSRSGAAARGRAGVQRRRARSGSTGPSKLQ